MIILGLHREKGKMEAFHNVTATYKEIILCTSAKEIKDKKKILYIGCYVLWHTNMD